MRHCITSYIRLMWNAQNCVQRPIQLHLDYHLHNILLTSVLKSWHQNCMQTLAPTIWGILQEIVTPSGKYKRKEAQRHHASEYMVIAVATLSRERNEHMSIVAHLIGLILWQGNVSAKVYMPAWMSALSISHVLH